MNEQNYGAIFKSVISIGVTISIFLLTLIYGKVTDMDQKLFKHLTNDELHTPRSCVVSREEFELYRDFTESYFIETRRAIEYLRKDLGNEQSTKK
jgi:hypothetical protein